MIRLASRKRIVHEAPSRKMMCFTGNAPQECPPMGKPSLSSARLCLCIYFAGCRHASPFNTLPSWGSAFPGESTGIVIVGNGLSTFKNAIFCYATAPAIKNYICLFFPAKTSAFPFPPVVHCQLQGFGPHRQLLRDDGRSQ